MRSIRIIASSLAAIALLALPAIAQDKGTFDVGIFGRADWLDNSYNTNTGFGGGARLGWFFAKNLEIAVDASANSADAQGGGSSVSYTPFHARLDYWLPFTKRFALLIGAGYSHESFSGSGTSRSDNGFGGTVGVRMDFGKRMYALLNYTADYSSSPAIPTASSTLNNGLELGIGWLLGGKKAEAAAAPAAAAPAPPPAPAPVPPPAAAAPVVAAPPADDDHDGVANTADACPNTPAGEAVDAKGCSESQKDDDHDGVMNNADKCPNTPAGTEVDKNGCRIAPLILKGVNFETAKAVLLPSASATLDTVATALLAHPTVKIQISGYTDNVGNAASNTTLSQQRADAVKAYLMNKGVPADQVVAKGFGPENAIAPNDTDAGRAANRRVELKILSE